MSQLAAKQATAPRSGEGFDKKESTTCVEREEDQGGEGGVLAETSPHTEESARVCRAIQI